MEVNLYFGLRRLIEYKIGDKVEWVPQKSIQNGGRPEEGHLNGEAYSECPKCRKDFFLTVNIKEDIMESFEADLEKSPYVPD